MTGFADPVDAVRDVLGMPRETPLDYPELVHPEPRADEPVVYDHKAEAVRLLSIGAPTDEVQAHATLALVDAQHLSNLIAYLAISQSRGARDEKHYALEEMVQTELGL